MPDVVNAALEQSLLTDTTTTATTTTCSSNVSEMICDESDGSAVSTPDMDPQMLYVRLKEVRFSTIIFYCTIIYLFVYC